MNNFQNFLNRNSVQLSKSLPLVHSTKAQHIRSMMETGSLRASPCDVFQGENLNYFFVGRPAFKERDDGAIAEHWQLPCCFIFEYEAVKSIKRMFPFDSGAFVGKRYPKHINDMPIEDFESSIVPDAPQRIIGAFFGDTAAYMSLTPKDKSAFEREFTLKILDHDIRALHKLAVDSGNNHADDRRLTIEIQTEETLDLTVVKPLAVVAPNTYFQDETVRNYVVDKLSAQPISYPTHPLSLEKYYHAIYESVADFYRSKNIL